MIFFIKCVTFTPFEFTQLFVNIHMYVYDNMNVNLLILQIDRIEIVE